MWWASPEFKAQCAKLGVEPIIERDSDVVRLVCAKIPEKKVQAEILKDAPVDEIKFEWVEDLKDSTAGALRRAFNQLEMVRAIKSSSLNKVAPHRVKVELTANAEFPVGDFLAKDSKSISTFEELLRNDGYVDHYEILIDGKEVAVYDRNVSMAVAEQNKTDRRKITADDITDVKILLGSCDSVEDFLAKI